jgi:chaperonin GroES
MQAFKRVVPLLNRVMIQRVEAPKQTAGGILLPEIKDNDLQIGTVVSTGPGLYEEGKFRECLVKSGQKVLLPSYGGQVVEVDDKKFYIFRDTELVGIVE